MSLYGTLASPPSPEQARVLFAEFTSRLARRRAWFVERVAESGGPATDGTVESLDPLLEHVVAHLRVDQPEQAPPDWFPPLREETGWTDRGAALVEGLMAYVADVVIGRTGARWELDEDPRSAFAGQPVLSDRTAPPWHLVLQAVRRVDADPTAKKLERGVRANLSAVANLPSASGPEPLDVEVTPLEHPPWNVQVSIPEWAEDALGTPTFDGLADLFRSVDGVDDVLHEDREVFLARTDGSVGHAVLRERLQSALDRAAGHASSA